MEMILMSRDLQHLISTEFLLVINMAESEKDSFEAESQEEVFEAASQEQI